jgi:hypothetical protein
MHLLRRRQRALPRAAGGAQRRVDPRGGGEHHGGVRGVEAGGRRGGFRQHASRGRLR